MGDIEVEGFSNNDSGHNLASASEVLQIIGGKSDRFYADKLKSLKNGEGVVFEDVAVVFCYYEVEEKEKHIATEEESAKNNFLAQGITDSISFLAQHKARPDLLVALIAAGVILGRSSWEEMSLCYDAAIKIAINPSLSVVDVLEELGMTDEEIEFLDGKQK